DAGLLWLGLRHSGGIYHRDAAGLALKDSRSFAFARSRALIGQLTPGLRPGLQILRPFGALFLRSRGRRSTQTTPSPCEGHSNRENALKRHGIAIILGVIRAQKRRVTGNPAPSL